MLGHGVVEIERRIFAAPGVVAPIDERSRLVRRADEERRAVIAHPGVVGGDVAERDVFDVADELLCLVVHAHAAGNAVAAGEDVDVLVRGEDLRRAAR